MKRYRSALMAGLLALAVAVCDDEGTVVQPPPVVNVAPPQVTVTVPPAPPAVAPLAAMITPSSAEVGVDGMVDFAVGTTGGSGDASWTCTSSDPAVATVETTDTGCRATAVAGGGVTITAAVTKGSESTNVAAQLTVGTTTDALILVTTVSGEPAKPGGDPTDVSGLKGKVTATIQIERGNQTPEKLSLNVDGMEVASQDFGPAPAAEDAEQQTILKLSFNSAEYEEHGDHVDVEYMNGDYMIQATLKVAGRDEALTSNMVAVEFDNDDKLMASMSGLGEGAANASTGQMWYGGPDASVEISALPVVYSSGGVSSVTLRKFCGDDAMTDSEAPFMFEVDCDDYTTDTDMYPGGEKPKFNVGGDSIGVSADAVYLDFEGPMAPHFYPDPNMRDEGWVNLTVGFLSKQSSSNKDGWLTYNDDNADDGVGGYMPQLRVSTTTPSIVDGALAAGVVEGVPALPAGGTKADAVCAVVTAVDLLGNESKLPKAGKACVMADGYRAKLDALKTARDAEEEDDIKKAMANIPAGIRAGLDTMVPTIAFSTASPKKNATSLKNFQVQVADPGGSTGKSGLHDMPVLAKIEVRNAKDEMICGDQKDVGGPVGEKKDTGECVPSANNIDFTNPPLATTAGLSPSPKMHGYYTFTAHARDKAGNKSETLVRTAVNDDEKPQAGLIVGGYSKGAYTLTVTATDDLSIKSYWPEQRVLGTSMNQTNASSGLDVGFSATDIVKILPSEGLVMVDEYNGSLTQNHLETITMKSFRAVQNNTALTAGDASTPATTTPLDPGEMIVVALDQSGAADSTEVDLSAPSKPSIFGIRATGTGTDDDGNTTTTHPAIPVTTGVTGKVQPAPKYKRDQVFQTFSADKTSDDDDVVEFRAEIVGIAGYKAAVAGVDNPGTENDVNAAAGEEGLVGNPVARVDFYALVDLKDRSSTNMNNRLPPAPDGPGDEALMLIASVSAAGAEDFTHNNGTTEDTDAARADDYAARKYVWSADVGAAEVLAAIGSKERSEDVQFIAVAVNSDGVAIIDAVSDTGGLATVGVAR